MRAPPQGFDHYTMDNGSTLAPWRRIQVEQLLRHCFALGVTGNRRVPASVRLEEALGPDLARRLVRTLTVGSRG